MKEKPAYLHIYETLRQEISEGVWAYGSRLPSKRDLADRFGVSVITAEHAYELLGEEGYIRAKERSGYFVSYRETDLFYAPAVRVRSHHEEGGHLGEEFPFSVYAKTVRRVLTEYETEVFRRGPNFGTMELREALSRYLARNRRMEVDPRQIVIGAGSEYLYGQILQFLGRGRVYAIEDPSYEKIEQVYGAYGMELRLLPLGSRGIESAPLAETDATVLHITPYRSFPSGVTASAAKKREYLRWAEGKNGVIIEDDFESEFTPSSKPEETVFSLDKTGRVIYLNTFSKTFSPSFRVAYMVLPTELLSAFEEKQGFYSCTVPTVASVVHPHRT